MVDQLEQAAVRPVCAGDGHTGFKPVPPRCLRRGHGRCGGATSDCLPPPSVLSRVPYWCLVLEPVDPNHEGVDVEQDGAQWAASSGRVRRDRQFGLPDGRPVRCVLAGGGDPDGRVRGRRQVGTTRQQAKGDLGETRLDQPRSSSRLSGRSRQDIGSERMLNGDPDYARYPGSVEAWHDGTRLTDEEQTQLLDGTVVERGENHVRSRHDL
jgi:hypothetical protein